jgi:pimeloyl-ACP methyl ester carboxylesterase
VTHHCLDLNGTELHYVSAGETGSPVLLVHGFPESWWTFHKLIPLLANDHRVFAVDLRGFAPQPWPPVAIAAAQTCVAEALAALEPCAAPREPLVASLVGQAGRELLLVLPPSHQESEAR